MHRKWDRFEDIAHHAILVTDETVEEVRDGESDDHAR
jgi:hypothetical protein